MATVRPCPFAWPSATFARRTWSAVARVRARLGRAISTLVLDERSKRAGARSSVARATARTAAASKRIDTVHPVATEFVPDAASVAVRFGVVFALHFFPSRAQRNAPSSAFASRGFLIAGSWRRPLAPMALPATPMAPPDALSVDAPHDVATDSAPVGDVHSDASDGFAPHGRCPGGPRLPYRQVVSGGWRTGVGQPANTADLRTPADTGASDVSQRSSKS